MQKAVANNDYGSFLSRHCVWVCTSTSRRFNDRDIRGAARAALQRWEADKPSPFHQNTQLLNHRTKDAIQRLFAAHIANAFRRMLSRRRTLQNIHIPRVHWSVSLGDWLMSIRTFDFWNRENYKSLSLLFCLTKLLYRVDSEIIMYLNSSAQLTINKIEAQTMNFLKVLSLIKKSIQEIEGIMFIA